MKAHQRIAAPGSRAFTLIELLMVIAIIGILAGMVLVGGNTFVKKSRISRTRAELVQLETAIDNYKAFKGVLPPDGKLSCAVAPLFYELSGTMPVGATYQTLDGDDSLPTEQVKANFGRSGFLNASGDRAEVRTFLKIQKGTQTKATSSGVILLVAPVEGPAYPGLPADVNPWCYVSSNPTNNNATAAGGGYDLWADISVRNTFGGYTTYRISNWQSTPIQLP